MNASSESQAPESQHAAIEEVTPAAVAAQIQPEAESLPVPTAGRFVAYRLADHDVQSIKDRRTASDGLFHGNPVSEGQTFPMLITEAWSGESPNKAVNGQVFLDGNDTLCVCSRLHGEAAGTWSWPKR